MATEPRLNQVSALLGSRRLASCQVATASSGRPWWYRARARLLKAPALVGSSSMAFLAAASASAQLAYLEARRRPGSRRCRRCRARLLWLWPGGEGGSGVFALQLGQGHVAEGDHVGHLAGQRLEHVQAFVQPSGIEQRQAEPRFGCRRWRFSRRPRLQDADRFFAAPGADQRGGEVEPGHFHVGPLRHHLAAEGHGAVELAGVEEDHHFLHFRLDSGELAQVLLGRVALFFLRLAHQTAEAAQLGNFLVRQGAAVGRPFRAGGQRFGQGAGEPALVVDQILFFLGSVRRS